MYSATKSRPQHDRVSSLRSKRRSVSTNEGEQTPRQLLQGFLESEDTTAPLVRYTSRTSQDRMSSSQPALLRSGRKSSQSAAGNWTFAMDSDTPRTLLQKYVLSTTAAFETPAPRPSVPQQQTPDIDHVPVQVPYHTPSPFKTNTARSDGLDEMLTPRSTGRKTSRSASRKKGKFSLSMIEGFDSAVDESVIPPTNPADYQEPSFFRASSSDEESYVSESTHPSIGTSYNRSQHHQGHFNISVPDAIREEISQYQQSQGQFIEKIDETRNQTGDFENEGTSGSENEQDYEDQQGTRMESLGNQPGTNILPDWNEYTIPLKDNEMERSPVISNKGYHNSSLSEDYHSQRSDRKHDPRRMGRWSEGHRSRLESPYAGENRVGQPSGHHRRSLPGHMPVQQRFSSEEQNLRHLDLNRSPIDQFEDDISQAEISRHDRSGQYKQLKDRSKSKEIKARMSSGEIDRVVDALSPSATRSYNEEVDEMYAAEKSVSNIWGNFSPKITSTQRNLSVNTQMNNDDRPLPTVTPSPVVSPNASLRSKTPSSTRTSGSRVLTPSQRENLSTSVSPVSSVRSISSRGSSRKSASKVLTPKQTVTPAGSRNSTLGSSGKKSRQESVTPLQTVTPSPVVSSGGSGMAESPSSLALKPSTRMSTTPSQIDEQGSFRKDSPREERSRSMQNRSRSEVETLSSRSPAASPVVASRRLAQDMVNTLPNNTANFSPQIASTQNIAAISRIGQNAAEKRPEEEIADVPEDDGGQWQEEMDIDQGESNTHETPAHSSTLNNTETVKKPKKVVRRPRQKSHYSLPVNVVKKQFTHFAGLRASKEAIEEVMKVSEKYWDTLARDLEAYAKHGGRKQINMSDFVLLFKRQGYVTEKQSLKSLIEKYLPMEEREKLIPVARAGNRIEPKL